MLKIAVCNCKGGVGKTTSTINLGACFEKEFKKKVLLVEIDTQGNMSKVLLRHGKITPKKSLKDVMYGDEDVIINNLEFYVRNRLTKTNIDIIASSEDMKFDFPQSGEQYKSLISFFSKIEKDYDVCIFDCPPSTANNYVFATFMIADFILIPCEAEEFSLDGYKIVAKDMESFRAVAGKKVKATILGALINNYENITEHKEWYERAKEKNSFLDAKINRHAEIRNAKLDGRPVAYFSPVSKAEREYIDVCNEIVRRAKIIKNMKKAGVK